MKKVIIGLLLCMFLIGVIGLVSAVNDCVSNSDCALKDKPFCCGNETQYVKGCYHINQIPEEVNCSSMGPCPGLTAVNSCMCENNQCVGKYIQDNENETEVDDKNETDVEDGNVSSGRGLGQIIRNRVHAGVYTSPEGEEIRVSEMAQNRLNLMVGNKSVDCDDCNISEERENNRTRLKMHLSNGNSIIIKIMPNTASERALERLRLKVCNESNNCTIQLKEVGKGNRTIAVYEMQVQRHARLLWLFKIKANEKAQVDSETGEIILVKKPWWSFLASKSD